MRLQMDREKKTKENSDHSLLPTQAGASAASHRRCRAGVRWRAGGGGHCVQNEKVVHAGYRVAPAHRSFYDPYAVVATTRHPDAK